MSEWETIDEDKYNHLSKLKVENGYLYKNILRVSQTGMYDDFKISMVFVPDAKVKQDKHAMYRCAVCSDTLEYTLGNKNVVHIEPCNYCLVIAGQDAIADNS